YQAHFNKKPTKSVLEAFLKFRPAADIIQQYKDFVIAFWNEFSNNLTFIRDYLGEAEDAAIEFRNPDGGNLVFRPVGFLPLVQASLLINKRTEAPFAE